MTISNKNTSGLSKKGLVLFLFAFFFSLVFALAVYIFLLQTPNLSRRELFYTFLLWILFTPLVYLLLTRFLLPRLSTYTPRARRNWILLSVGIGLLFALVTRPPQIILLFPVHDLEISIPAGSAERTVTLEYANTSLRDIGFGEFKQEGDWHRTEAGLTHIGAEPALLAWSGRTGEAATLVFSNKPGMEGVRMGWNGENGLEVTGERGASPIVFGQKFSTGVTGLIFSRLLTGLLAGFIFLAIGLYLAAVQFKPAGEVELKRGSWLLYALPMIAVWGLFLLTFWPGMMSNDSSKQWFQITTGRFDDTHPVFHTLVMWLITRVWFSPAAVAIFQILALSLTVAFGIRILNEQGLPAWAAWTLATIFALFPLNQILVITLWKDILYSTCLLFLSLIILKIIFTKGKWLEGKFSWIMLGIVSVCVGSFRHNGLPIPLLSLPILFLVYRKWWKSLLSSFAFFIIITILIRGPLYSAIGVDRQTEAMERLFAHHIAAHVINIESQPPEIVEEINEIFDLKSFNYDCCNQVISAVSLKSGFSNLQTNNTIRTLLPKLLISEPLTELKHQSCVTSVIWELPTRCTRTGLLPFSNTWISQKYITVKEDSKLPPLLPLFFSYSNWMKSYQSITIIMNPSNYLYLAILFTGFLSFRKRNPEFLLFIFPAAVNSLILLIVNFSDELRFQYGVVLYGLFGFGLLILALCTPKEMQPGLISKTQPRDKRV